MSFLNPDHIAKVTRDFLQNPGDQHCFNEFFQVCFHLTRGYLRLLESRGHRLPLQEFAGSNPRDDLAIDCLDTLFRSEKGKPFAMILRYLRERIDTATPASEIVAMLHSLLGRQVRQRLFNLAKEYDPQGANIRRAVIRAMEDSRYLSFRHGGQEVWGLRETTDQRENLPPIDDNTLHSYVIKASGQKSDMPARCAMVFEFLDHDDRFANCIEQSRLIKFMREVLTELPFESLSTSPDPQAVYRRKIIAQSAAQAIQKTINGALTHLTAKQKFSAEVIAGYREALTELVFDFIHHGTHDPLPHYLTTTLDIPDNKTYLNRHKYIWETCVAECKSSLRRFLRQAGLEP